MEAKKVTNPPSLREGKGVGPIVFATNNLHKLQEIRHILGDEIEVKSLSDIGCDADIPETGSTLEENARQKAEYVWQNYHCDVFADDTGLEVEALGGAPGVYSARYASLASPAGSPTAEAHDSEANMARLLHEMEYADNRRARFRTVIALIRKRDVCPCGCTSIKEEHLFEGIVNGEIKRERSGVGGFGYDPIFLPDGSSKTFAEMSEEEKNQISHRGRATAKLCAFLRSTLLLLTVIFSLFTSPVMAQIGTWHAYMSYNEPQQIVAGGHQLFVRASNSLYSYNLNDHSITTYDKVTSLSDTHVSLIAWNKAAQRLIIVYDNSNIDLMDANGTVTNISALFLKSMTQDKTVNTIFCNGVYAYLGTGFGVVKVNMERAEISESYILSMNVTAIGTDQTSLYIRDKDGYVLSGNMSSNLIDPHKWSAATAPDGIFEADNSDWDEYAELVKALSPDGPKSNHFEYMTFINDRLYTCSGGTYEGNIQVLQDGEWTFYQDTDMKAISGLDTYKGVVVLAVDPENPDHVYAGARNGLYEFQEGKLINQYNHANSPLGMYKGERAEVQMITGLAFDGNGNLWVLESQDVDVALLKLDTKTGQWTTADLPELMQLSISGMPHSLGLLKNIVIDKQGYVWFINDHYDLDSFYCVDPQTMKFVNRFESFTNQDGTTYADYRPHCLVEDFDGNLWLGTKVGPFMLDRANLYTKDTYLTQVKVPRNDGSDYADYLLSGANVSTMAIDGGNRKWIGTSGTGVYLISADNMEQIHNFTTANSPLLSDNILSIAIDPKTGEVFFGTDQGLCSYNSDATVASIEMEKDNVYAYPNPVVSGYNGLITVVGLSFNADVKVLTTSGQLVAQGRSNGGTFTWDGRDRQGRRVASGVYMVAAATSEGKKGVVCKIAVIN